MTVTLELKKVLVSLSTGLAGFLQAGLCPSTVLAGQHRDYMFPY